jgi:hypothetical protein
MTKRAIFAAFMLTIVPAMAQPDPNYKPRRLNKAIELLEDGQPIYYTGAVGGSAGYEEGKKMAQTWADVVMYEMEHDPFDLQKLKEFMKGIAYRYSDTTQLTSAQTPGSSRRFWQRE